MTDAEKIAEIEKRHAEVHAEANGHGDFNFHEWCLRNGSRAHKDRATLIALLRAKVAPTETARQ